jgi:hypothetical protein
VKIPENLSNLQASKFLDEDIAIVLSCNELTFATIRKVVERVILAVKVIVKELLLLSYHKDLPTIAMEF